MVTPLILGKVTSEQQCGALMTLSPEALQTHAVILGSTGSGKSRLIRKLCEDHLNRGWGFALIDIHGDTAEDVLGVAAKQVVESGSKALLRRLHYLEFSPFSCPRFDPFHFEPPTTIDSSLQENARRAWLSAQADLYASILQSKQGYSDFEGQPRLQRMLRNVLISCGTGINKQRLPLGAAGILIDLGHPLHQEVYQALLPFLPREVQADFETLHQFKRMEDIRRECESTLNRLRSFFSPLLSASLSHPGPALDFSAIIQQGHAFLANLRQTAYFSHDQGVGIGKMFIHNLIHAMETMPREKRRPFTIIVEEAGELISDEIQRALGAVRKYQCRIILCGQDLSTFRKKDLDLVPKLLSQCGVVCSFNQKWPEDCELLARVLHTADLSFTPLEHEVERHDGYDWLKVLELSKSSQLSDSWSHQQGRSQSVGHSTQQSASINHQQNSSNSYSGSRGAIQSVGGGQSVSQGRSEGISESHGVNESNSIGGSMSVGHSESEKLVHLARIVREKQMTGQLEQSIFDQLEKFRQRIATLPPRHAILTVQGSPAVEFQTMTVPDPFVSVEALIRAVDWVKRELQKIHEYLFVPNLNLEQEELLLRDFLNQVQRKSKPSAPLQESSPERKPSAGNPFS